MDRGEIPDALNPLTNMYRVEVHNGQTWADGIRFNKNTQVPEFCRLARADQFGDPRDALRFCQQAARICGGTLRVARVPADA